MNSNYSVWPFHSKSHNSFSMSESVTSSNSDYSSNNADLHQEVYIDGRSGVMEGHGLGPGTEFRNSCEKVWENGKKEIKNWTEVNNVSDMSRDSRIGDHFYDKEFQLGLDGKPDLLDSLIMEDEMYKVPQAQSPMPYLENLFKLIQLQDISEAMASCPVSGANIHPRHVDALSDEWIMSMPNQIVRGNLPLINFKIKPPQHPPAANFMSADVPSGSLLSPVSGLLTCCSPSPELSVNIQIRTDELLLQFEGLENDRKKTEAHLIVLNPGRRISSSNCIPVPRVPPSGTKLDKLLVGIMKEQARVITLLERFEKVKGQPLSYEQCAVLAKWKESVAKVIVTRRNERMRYLGRDCGKKLGEELTKLTIDTRSTRAVLRSIIANGSI